MKLEIEIKNTENVNNLTKADVVSIQEIVTALISTGSLTGVRGGQTIIHFDADGIFQGVQIDYWPWRRRRLTHTQR